MEILTTGKNCRVKIPVDAHIWMEQENTRIKAETNERVIPITTVIEALLVVGLRAGGWQEIAREMAAQRKPITRQGCDLRRKKK